jgi:hypothetical protein
MKIAGMVVLAALAGWLVRDIRTEDPPPPQPTASSIHCAAA